MTTGSALSHGTYDGVGGNKGGKMRVREVTEKDDKEEEDEDEVEKGTRTQSASTKNLRAKQPPYDSPEKGESKRSHAGVVPGGIPDDESESDGFTKCASCEGKETLHKAKESLTGIYSMLKKLIQSDKKMVEKDEQVHASMEKAGEGEDEKKAFSRAGRSAVEGREQKKPGMHNPTEASRDYGERQTNKLRSRFQKGAIRPKVTEEKVEPKKIGTSQPTNKNVEEVEKGSMTKINERGTAESAQSAQDSHTSDVKIYNHKTGDFEGPVKKGTRPKVTEEPATKESMSQPVDKRVVEKGWAHAAVRTETQKVSQTERNRGDKTREGRELGAKIGRTLQKGDTMTEENVIEKAKVEDISDEQFVEEIVKAHMPNTDEIVKATNAQFDEIKKALTELKGEIEKIKEQPIQKAAVVISEDAPQGTNLNYAAMDEFFKKRA
jgi:hypothetical protein